MARIEIVEVTDETHFGLVPPCADPSFDHRTCDYWEDADRGSKASRPGWLPSSTGSSAASSAGAAGSPGTPANPFAPPPRTSANPFAPPPRVAGHNPFLDDLGGPSDDNPFAPKRQARPTITAEAPRKLQLLGRGLAIFGSYAKLLLADGEAAA
ncbi:MAG: hypothetical protein ACXWN4_03910, partial [Candidatus Limnocylindrales bacterium]